MKRSLVFWFFSLAFMTSALATECETSKTVNVLTNDIIECQELLDNMCGSDNPYKTPSELKKAWSTKFETASAEFNREPNFYKRFLARLANGMNDGINIAEDSVSLSNPHAIDFNDKIDRYTCQATLKFNFEKMIIVRRMKFYHGLFVVFTSKEAPTETRSYQISSLFLTVLESKDEDKINQLLNFFVALVDHHTEELFSGPVDVTYTVQQTANGLLVQLTRRLDESAKE